MPNINPTPVGQPTTVELNAIKDERELLLRVADVLLYGREECQIPQAHGAFVRRDESGMIYESCDMGTIYLMIGAMDEEDFPVTISREDWDLRDLRLLNGEHLFAWVVKRNDENLSSNDTINELRRRANRPAESE